VTCGKQAIMSSLENTARQRYGYFEPLIACSVLISTVVDDIE